MFLDEIAFEGMQRGIAFFIEAHYVREVWEIEVPIDVPVETEGDLQRLKERFHRRHDELYAVTDPEADMEIVSWRARAWCQLPRAAARGAQRTAASPVPPASTRDAYFADHGWLPTATCEIRQLETGQRLYGPAIVTSPVTTTVIDPGASAVMQHGGSLVITFAKRTSDVSVHDV